MDGTTCDGQVVVPAVVAGSGKMLIAQAASSVNPCDYQMLEGAASQSLVYPYIPGYDVAGTVVSVDASSAAVGSNGRTSNNEWLVLDTISNFDGLERLVVIAIGLDEPLQSQSLSRTACSQ